MSRRSRPTLENWLEWNDAENIFDAELLDGVLPAEFRDEYADRLRLNAEYEAKFAGREDSCSGQYRLSRVHQAD